ncbi:MAG: cell division protein FtsL [Deltaproteobacteria bacterium]|nr:cell division protein FtsL [Deltaproteobacteria bacterium]
MMSIGSKNFLFSSIIFIIFLTIWAMSHVSTRNMATELGYAISKQQSVNEELLSDNNALRLEISTLKSSKRLEGIAKHELDLHIPRSDQMVYLWADD